MASDSDISNCFRDTCFWRRVVMVAVTLTWLAFDVAMASATDVAARLVSHQGTVEVLRVGDGNWVSVTNEVVLYPGDAVRTGDRTRAMIRLADQSAVRMDENAYLRLEPFPNRRDRSLLNLLKGVIYFFHRDKPADAPFRTPLVSGAIRGTEFNLVVEAEGRTVLTLIDGVVELENARGRLSMLSGETAVCEPDKEPVKTAVVRARNVIEWCLYYPAVLDPGELDLGPATRDALQSSLDAYRAGNLLEALRRYPAERKSSNESEVAYRAALLLGVGQAEEASNLLGAAAPSRAIRKMMAAVTLEADTEALPPSTASEWLAESYYRQSRGDLVTALEAARAVVKRSPSFGFAWARVAELEFGFGRTREALAALDRGLELSPENSQASVLKGFLLASETRRDEALQWFDRAIELDGALANGWLGRGLVRLAQGDAAAGREDLLVAAAVEPNRSLLRSYLGKAFDADANEPLAEHELALARQLDPGDPTPWLYSALLNQRRNRINEAVEELERSKTLNDNRRLYRSRLLLDQDQAVRAANLAGIYRDAGMLDVSVEESVSALNDDYANASGHLFLANSYAQLADPGLVSLRYEAARVNEFLLASLLSPVGVGTLSQHVSQQEYSRLFDQDRLGVVSSTEYFSRGDWRQTASQFGQRGRLGYAVDVDYLSRRGWRANGDLERVVASLKLKLQLTPRDRLYLQTFGLDLEGGDLAQYYDPAEANRDLRVSEVQEGAVLAGYHREWQPGVHTLVLAGRLPGRLEIDNPGQVIPMVVHTNAATPITAAFPMAAGQDYRTELEVFTAELQQILQQDRYGLVLGGRAQGGTFDTHNRHEIRQVDIPISMTLTQSFFPSQFDAPVQNVEADFERWSVYAYPQIRLTSSLLLSAGVSYDRLRYPRNFRYAPLVDGEETEDQLSPKGGLIWTPGKRTTIRAAYARSLGGVSVDQSFRLEPSQVGGFNQAWRSLIPESIAGANAAESFETWGVSLHHAFPTRTYLTLRAELLESEVERVTGVYDVRPFAVGGGPFIFQSGTLETLDFRERSVSFSLDQLLGDEFVVGARYHLSEAELDQRYTDVPGTAVPLAGFERSQHLESVLHQLNLRAVYHHPGGVFVVGESLWHRQSNRGSTVSQPGDDFWQFNLYAGYRLPGRRAELMIGVLNLGDEDYRLSPLNLHSALPRERTFMARLSFFF